MYNLLILSYIFYGCLVLLQILDVYTTYKEISSGVGRESNKIMLFFINKLGLLCGLVLPKVVIISLLGFILLCPSFATLAGGQANIGMVALSLFTLSVIYCYVVRNNFKLLKT